MGSSVSSFWPSPTTNEDVAIITQPQETEVKEIESAYSYQVSGKDSALRGLKVLTEGAPSPIPARALLVPVDDTERERALDNVIATLFHHGNVRVPFCAFYCIIPQSHELAMKKKDMPF
jgi:hypothetical protein